MAKKVLNVILLIIFVLFLSGLFMFVLFMTLKSNEKSFNKIEITNTIYVTNFTPNKYIDTIIVAGLNIMNIDSVVVVVYPLTEKIKEISEGEVQATIFNQGNIYMIFIDNLSRTQTIDIIAHELIHLKQYYEGSLKLLDNSVMWNNEVYNYGEIDYINRPWEREAMINEFEFSKRIRKELYE